MSAPPFEKANPDVVGPGDLSIRVNLRFGTRTDPGLMLTLSKLRPKDRARWVRQWLTEGWRRSQSTGAALSLGETITPPSVLAPPQQQVRSAPHTTLNDRRNLLPTISVDEGIEAFLGERIV